MDFIMNIILVASFLSASYILADITNHIIFSKYKFINFNELMHFFQFISKNNPLLLTYYDSDDNNTDNIKNGDDFKQEQENEQKPVLVELFETKYLEKYKKFPNNFIFYDFELEDEKVEYEKLKTEYYETNNALINEIKDAITKITTIEYMSDVEQQRAALIEYEYTSDENIEEEAICSLLFNYKTEKLTELKTVTDNIKPDEQFWSEARDIIVNKKLDKYIDNYILEYTPLGNVYMRYNNDKKSFEYFSDKSIPYRYLEVLGRKYIMTYWCKPIFVDLEDELKKAEEKYDENKKKKMEDDRIKEMEIINNPKRILAQLKNYNKVSKEQTIRPRQMKNRENSNAILPPQIKSNLPDINKTSDKQLVKDKANRYTWEGRLINFSPLKKIDKKLVDKNLGLTYADFKKLRFGCNTVL
jgi:hypothetical protein